MKAVIWSKPGCSFCEQAQKLLEMKGYQVDERKLGFGWNREQLLESVPNAKSVPQIFVDGKYIGGFTELRAYLQDKGE